jgi:hypothetical protein
MPTRRTLNIIRGSSLALAASFAVLVPAAQAASGRESRSSRPAPCRLQVHSVDTEPSTAGRTPPRLGRVFEFAAYETAMLEFDLLCAGEAPIAESTRIELHLPSGERYQTLTMEMTPTTEATSRRGGFRVMGTAQFPVRGTFITQNQLFGRWGAKLCRELGARELCDKEVSFELLAD